MKGAPCEVRAPPPGTVGTTGVKNQAGVPPPRLESPSELQCTVTPRDGQAVMVPQTMMRRADPDSAHRSTPLLLELASQPRSSRWSPCVAGGTQRPQSWLGP